MLLAEALDHYHVDLERLYKVMIVDDGEQCNVERYLNILAHWSRIDGILIIDLDEGHHSDILQHHYRICTQGYTINAKRHH